MALRHRVLRSLVREPRHGTVDWILVGFGCAVTLLGIAGVLVPTARRSVLGIDPAFILLGLAFLLMGGAELVPVDRRRLAAALRVGTVVAFVAWLAVRVLTM